MVKVAIATHFIPNIHHIIIILHGSAGSAKSTFQLLLKNIVDPAKPSLLTLHDNHSEFIQQLAHNYLSSYDNMKRVPPWLSDEVCKAVTGVGQTKRILYTVEDDKIYEYKHCLVFNGINITFSEPDALERSIVIHLDAIDDENRRTEKEILEEFYSLRPSILKYIFDVLAKAILIKDQVLKKIKKKPRMADYAIWGEAIAQEMGYNENEFLVAYYGNIGFQNNEVIESSPLAFAIKRLVDKYSTSMSLSSENSSSKTIFEGTPSDLLDDLNKIAIEEKINTNNREWTNDRKWLIRKINVIKTNLEKGLGLKININRDTKNNTSTINIEKNVSVVSGKHKMSPESNTLSPDSDSLSPEKELLSPEDIEDLSTKPNNSGDNRDNGDKSRYTMEDADREVNNYADRFKGQCIKCPKPSDPRIKHNHPFYYCVEHPKFENINLEVIESHLILAKDHNTL